MDAGTKWPKNPVQGEFFTAAADMPERLVREAIQNSMDAALPGEVVQVRFAFSGSDHALQPGRARTYLDGLENHLRGRRPLRNHPLQGKR